METMMTNLEWLAMGSPPGTESSAPVWVNIIPFVLIFAVFYLILIRPQQKQQKEHQKLLESLKSGDQVLLASGIYGIVAEIRDKDLLIKIADNVKVKVLRSSVTQVLSGGKDGGSK